MGSSRKQQILLLTSIVICTIVVSCKPPAKQTTPEKSESDSAERKAKVNKSVLSKEQILQIADRAARQRGLDPKKMTVIYDEGNAGWKQVVVGPPSKLEGRDFQAVSYWERPPVAEGGLWILVDRNTGEILGVATPP